MTIGRGRRGWLALACAAAALASCRNIDVVTASYRTLAEAREAGAIARGWVPEGLPEGTYELREAHDLDTNRRWGLFNFPPEQAAELKAILEPGEVNLAGVTCDIPGRVEWWPVLLRGRLDPERVRIAALKAYRASASDLLFLVNWEQGRAYYWTAIFEEDRSAKDEAPAAASERRPPSPMLRRGNLRG